MRQLLLLSFTIFTIAVQAQNANQRVEHFNIENGVALQGYDAVSYFTQSKAQKGKKQWAVKHQGITYYFANSQNKELFLKNPKAYEPQYGGWCAFAMGDYNKKVEVNPETFKIVDGKLYLFYNAFLTNTLNSWNKNEDVLKKQADLNWNQTLNTK